MGEGFDDSRSDNRDRNVQQPDRRELYLGEQVIDRGCQSAMGGFAITVRHVVSRRRGSAGDPSRAHGGGAEHRDLFHLG